MPCIQTGQDIWIMAEGPFAGPFKRASVIFQNREEAGRRLASRLHKYQDVPDGLILALPRGGVPGWIRAEHRSPSAIGYVHHSKLVGAPAILSMR